MPVRSTRLWGPRAQAGIGAWELCYTVPPDRTARFSLVTIVNPAAAQQIFLGIGTAAAVTERVWQNTVPANSSVEVLKGLILDDAEAVWCYVVTTAGVITAGFASLLLGDPA